MSASLVGSEMCIRDRVEGRLPSANAQHAAATLRQLPRAASSSSGTLGACLLYTSDAADDM
eukprot:9908096-Alexandrium_andersonii.AAC.1